MIPEGPVLCLGDLMLEVFVEAALAPGSTLSVPLAPRGDGPDPVLGGASLNVAFHLRQLGVEAMPVGVVASVLQDAWRETLAQSELSARGLLPSDELRQHDTLLVASDPGGDEAFRAAYVFDPGPGLEATTAHLRRLLDVGPRLLVLAGSRRPTLQRAALAVAERFDAVVFSPSYTLYQHPPEVVRASVAASELVVVNAAEARWLSEVLGSARPRRLLVTRDEHGLELYEDGETTIRVPAASEVRGDRVGAGDAVTAGVVAARLAGASWAEAAIEGAVQGAWVADAGVIRPPPDPRAWARYRARLEPPSARRGGPR